MEKDVKTGKIKVNKVRKEVYMARADLIKKLESERNSRVICYITGDRPPFPTRIAADAVPLLNGHLEKIGKTKKISLFLYTSGGDMLAPIRIVKLIRNYCDEFEVIVPYKAQSAGTLIALGADKIVMSRLGELSPVDPTTGHAFNPVNPSNPQQLLEVSVEDLNSYLLFAKDEARIPKAQMVEVYKLLGEKLHPLSIGNAYRTYRMAKILTKRLLYLHMNKDKDGTKIAKIVKDITGDITVHAYPIDREDASELGLNVEKTKGEGEKLIIQLYEDYASEMKLNQPFHPSELLGGKEVADFELNTAFIENSDFLHRFVVSGKVQKTIRNNQSAIDLNVDSQCWK